MLFSASEQWEVLQYVSRLVVCFILPTLIRCVSVYYKDQRYCITQWLPTCFDQSCGLLQGGKNKNIDIYLCRYYSIVNIYTGLVKIQFKR